MKNFLTNFLLLTFIVSTAVAQTAFTNVQFLTGASNTGEPLNTTATTVFNNNTVFPFNTINDVTGAKLTVDNGDIKDFNFSGNSILAITNAPVTTNATVRLNPSSNSRIQFDHGYSGTEPSNNPGMVNTNTLKLLFSSNLVVRDASFSFSSINTAGVAWEHTVIQFLDVNGVPFSPITGPAWTLGIPSSYLTAAATGGFSGNAGVGNFVAASTATNTGVGTNTVASGANGPNDLLTLTYANTGLPANTIIGGIQWTTYLEDVRGISNTNSNFTASLFDFTLSGTVNTVLPIENVTLTGSKQNAINVINWSTVNETNIKGFEVQQSKNGINYNTLTFVNSKAILGNGNNNQAYTYNDISTNNGTNTYYRLVQVATDNSRKNTEVLLIKGTKNNLNLAISTYPNPFVNQLQVSIYSETINNVAINLYNANGKLLIGKNVVTPIGTVTVPLPVANLPKGIYIVKVQTLGGTTLDQASSFVIKQ